MVTRKSPPETPPSFEQLTPHEILAETNAILDTTSALHDHLVAALSPATVAFANVVRIIADDANRAACRLVILSNLLSQLSPSAEARQAARQAEVRIAEAQTKILMRHDIAALIVAVYARETTKLSGELDDEDRHLLSSVYRKYVNSGAALRDGNERGRLRAASKELNEICAAAQNTFIEPEEGLWFERSELAGVPESVLGTMVEDDTRLQVTFRRDHISAVMCHATNSAIRRRFTIANWHRHPGNIARLQRAIVLRDEIARMLGF